MKKTCLVLCVMVAVLMLFSATKVGAQTCPPPVLPPGGYFESNGYRVEIVPDIGPYPGCEVNFPKIDISGNRVFTYKFTRINPSAKSVSHIDILIPVCSPSLTTPTGACYVPCSPPYTGLCPVSCQGFLYAPGVGDSSTGFGLGLTLENTFKWSWSGKWSWPGITTGIVSLTYPPTPPDKTKIQPVYASPNAMLLKMGSSSRHYPYGQILASSCGLVPVQVFPPQVPLATKKQEKISDIEVCIESTDQSGFPTSVYSCDPLLVGTPACNCPEEKRDYWVNYPLSALHIDPSTLQQVWIDPDPRSPATYIITSGSTCVKKCYPSGYCYVGPKGCTP